LGRRLQEEQVNTGRRVNPASGIRGIVGRGLDKHGGGDEGADVVIKRVDGTN
jgi:hypothetical protein